MTDYEDKARTALNWALNHIAFRHEKRVVADVALAMEQLVAAEQKRVAMLGQAIMEAANVLDRHIYTSAADAKVAGDVALMLRSRSALAIRAHKP